MLNFGAKIENISLHGKIWGEVHALILENWAHKSILPASYGEMMSKYECSWAWKIYIHCHMSDKEMQSL